MLSKLASGFKSYIPLLAIFFLALAIRLYSLSRIPFSFQRDEVINAYVGRFILMNGKDLYGNSWPILFFDKFGDYPPVFPMYLMGFSTLIFGVNEFAARFPAAFFGAMIVFPIYYFSKLIYRSKKLGWLSALFIAILPWHIVLSRSSAEGIIGTTVFTFGLTGLLAGITKQRNLVTYFSFVLILISYLLYPGFRILAPLVLFPIPFFAAKKSPQKMFALFVLISWTTTIAISSQRWGRARFAQTSLLRDSTVTSKLEAYSFDEGPGKVLTARIFHNKVVGYGHEFLTQYVSYFSPEFLFVNGGMPYEYYVPDVGLVYVTFGILLLMNFLPISIVVDKKIFIYTIYLFLVASLPAALTKDFVPHSHRAIFFVVPLVMLITAGLAKMQGFFSNKIMIKKFVYVALSIIMLLEMLYFVHQYSSHLSFRRTLFRDDGYKELVNYLLNNQSKYQRIFTSSQAIPLYLLFFSGNFNPGLSNDFRAGLKIDRIENFKFIDKDCIVENVQQIGIEEGDLIVDGGDCKISPELVEFHQISRKDGTVAFKLFVP